MFMWQENYIWIIFQDRRRRTQCFVFLGSALLNLLFEFV